MRSKEQNREYSRIVRQRHPETNREYRQNNREKAREYQKEYYLANKDRVIARCNINKARRMALKRGLPYTLTIEQWEAIKRIYKYRCAYCGAKPEVLEQDHVIPVSRGGGTIAENIVPACKFCNCSKGNREVIKTPAIRLFI